MADFQSASFEGHNNFRRRSLRVLFVLKMPVSPVQSDFNERNFMLSVNFNLAAAPVPAVPLYFNGAKFTNHPPDFFGREMHEDTDWTDVELPSAKLQAAQPRGA